MPPKHASEWILHPKNCGQRLSIDETSLCDDLFTILSNKDGHGGKGTVVAMVKGTKAADVTRILMQLPEEQRLAVTEVTMDFSDSMEAIVRKAFPNATIVIDCFHIVKRCTDAVEKLRLKAKREAAKEQKRQKAALKKKLEQRPKARKDYRKKHPKKYKGRKHGRKPHEWYHKIAECTLREVKAARDTIKAKEEEVLNYFIARSTNASAESLNAKLKLFRTQLHGVSDLPSFLYRVSVIFGYPRHGSLRLPQNDAIRVLRRLKLHRNVQNNN